MKFLRFGVVWVGYAMVWYGVALINGPGVGILDLVSPSRISQLTWPLSANAPAGGTAPSSSVTGPSQPRGVLT